MKAVIIAAGDGTRMREFTGGMHKSLVKLLGVPLMERVILSAKEGGIRDFLIVTGYNAEEVERYFSDGKKWNVKIEYARNNEWERENGFSLLKAKEKVNENFLLLMCDHMFDPRIIKALSLQNPKAAVTLAVDRGPAREEDTKVLERDGKIVRIGKDIKEYNAIDTGIFLMTPKFFEHMQKAAENGGEKLSEGVMHAAESGDARIFDITKIDSYDSKLRKDVKPWWIDIDTKDDIKRAEKVIIENASKNPSDLLACYVHKPIENALVARISRFPITPNQITAIVNVIAYAATALFFAGQLLAASLITFVVGVIDGIDGKLARIKLMKTKTGFLEHSTDFLFEMSWIFALGFYLASSAGGVMPMVLSAAIIMLVGYYRSVYDQFRKAAGKSIDVAGKIEMKFRRIAGRRNLYNISIFISVALGMPMYGLWAVFIHAASTAAFYTASAFANLRKLDKKN